MHSLRAHCCLLYPVCQPELWCAPLSETAHRKMSFFSSVLSSLGCVKPVLSRQPDGMKVWCRKYPVGVEFLMTWQQTELSAPPPLPSCHAHSQKAPPAPHLREEDVFSSPLMFAFSLLTSALSLMLHTREEIIKKHISYMFVHRVKCTLAWGVERKACLVSWKTGSAFLAFTNNPSIGSQSTRSWLIFRDVCGTKTVWTAAFITDSSAPWINKDKYFPQPHCLRISVALLGGNGKKNQSAWKRKREREWGRKEWQKPSSMF